MAMTCTVCNHYNRPEIDRELMRGHSYTKIAKKYDLDHQAVRNHHLKHLSRQLVQAWERKQDAENRDLLAEIDELVERTKQILDKAEKQNKLKTALAGIRELRGSYELMARIAFSLHQAKEQDLEAKRIESGEHDHQQEQDFKERLKILSQSELMLLSALIEKLESQDSNINCIGKALDRKMLYLHWLENPDEFEMALNPLGIKHIDLLEPLKVEPIKLLDLNPDPTPEPDPPMKRTKKKGPGRPPGSKRLRDARSRMRRRTPSKATD